MSASRAASANCSSWNGFSVLLTIFFWVPGVIHALYIILMRR
ncbi:MAG: YqaE/Pmp3 family membrane protein [Acidimicrobiia bacterium]